MGGFLEASREYEQWLVEARRSGNEQLNWGSLIKILEESDGDESRFHYFKNLHRTSEECRASGCRPMTYGWFREYKI